LLALNENNLYGWSMEKVLPCGDITFNDDTQTMKKLTQQFLVVSQQ